jgi:hypothetical protein
MSIGQSNFKLCPKKPPVEGTEGKPVVGVVVVVVGRNAEPEIERKISAELAVNIPREAELTLVSLPERNCAGEYTCNHAIMCEKLLMAEQGAVPSATV